MVAAGYDAIIVGAGIAGASTAFFMAQRGHRVALLDKETRPGLHSTGRSAAMLIINYGEPQTIALAKVAEPFLREPPRGFCEHPLLSPRGCILLAGAGEAEALERAVTSARTNGVPGERLSPDEIAKLIPLIKREAICGALYEAGAASIDVDALHRGFLRGLRQLGGDLLVDAEATGFERRKGEWEVSTPHGVISAPLVVNAAGGWADILAERMGAARLGLTPCRRTAALTHPPEGSDISTWPLVLHVDETYYFKPDAGKLLISPGDETPVEPGDVQPDDFDVAVAIDRVERVADLNIKRVTHRWSGLRTFAADRRLVIGFDKNVEGLFWVAGQGGAGIMTSPSAGLLAAQLADGARPADVFAIAGLDAADLSPARLIA